MATPTRFFLNAFAPLYLLATSITTMPLRANQQADLGIAASDIKVKEGFTVDKIYDVPREKEGSWVGLAVDPKGRLLACDQYGALYRLTVPTAGTSEATQIEKINTTIKGIHGLLHLQDALYVVANEKYSDHEPHRPGLYKLQDLDGDGHYEKETLMREMNGHGEHGPHSIVLGPDGLLYVCAGNYTSLPTPLESSVAPKIWQEDHLLPRMWDANGHAVNLLAPGGYIYRIDQEGKNAELLCYGFRNQYDLAFNAQGELFTWDSDMEWDLGTPWYRPTRVVHCVSGADYGWRSGSGKWPAYYPDSLPPTYNIGPASPTGVVFGTEAKFPAAYQQACYIADWTYGTMYAVHLTPQGASYTARAEEFLSGKPLPLTDMVIHPGDGAMYFAIGGRKTQSALYRVRYTGSESTARVPTAPITAEMTLRRSLEKLHRPGLDAQAISEAWSQLGHDDRFIRTAARIALTHQPLDSWLPRLSSENRPHTLTEAVIALCHLGPKEMAHELQGQALQALSKLNFKELSHDQKLAALRALQLVFIRLGRPEPEVTSEIASRLSTFYPSEHHLTDRELCQLLIYLDSPVVVAKTIPMMETATDIETDIIASPELLARNDVFSGDVNKTIHSRPQRQQVALAWWLRAAKVGWIPELRERYFHWYGKAQRWNGGNSFSGFLTNAMKEALALAPEADHEKLLVLATKKPEATALTFTPPKGPGKNYTVADVLAIAPERLTTGRSYAQGKNLYAATACATCHRFAGEGGGLGPELTGSANRYTLHDLMEAIIDPSKVISDQYESTVYSLKDGTEVVGRPMLEENGQIFVAASPFTPDTRIAIKESDIIAKKPHPVSLMPPGLINSLNEEELLDLIYYLRSGGVEPK